VAALSVLLAVVFVAGAIAGQPSEPDRTAGVAEFGDWKKRHLEAGKTPEGALELWFEALFLYLEPESREVGRAGLQHLTISLRDDDGWERRPSSSRFVSRMRDPSHHHIFRSYAEGATPENGYAMDPESFQLRIEESSRDAHGRGWKVLLRSSGADNPRPVYLRRSTTSGLWFVDGFANVYVGIRPPASGEEFE
jgi:hypothetical protein